VPPPGDTNGRLRRWADMARPRPNEFEKSKIVAENRRARYDYFLEEFFEAGIALTGTEVKSLRFGEGSIAESYAEVKDGQVWLVNSNVPEFSHGNRFNHEPRRPRKLLLHQRQIEKMRNAVSREGMTLIKGKKLHDKRETEKARDWKREQQRLLRERG
jgi:SsrA-binding protein